MEGKAIIFSAPSGAGKTTIVHSLLERIPTLRFSVSATTRKKRSNEINGRDYYFLTLDEFKKKIEKNQLIEFEEVYKDTFYGTLKSEVDRIWDEGNYVIFDVDVKGGITLKKALGDRALSIFIRVANSEVLRDRLKLRNTEDEATLQMRVAKSIEEMKEENKFDKIVVNEVLDEAISEAEKLVKAFISK